MSHFWELCKIKIQLQYPLLYKKKTHWTAEGQFVDCYHWIMLTHLYDDNHNPEVVCQYLLFWERNWLQQCWQIGPPVFKLCTKREKSSVISWEWLFSHCFYFQLTAFLHGIHDCHEAQEEFCVDFFVLNKPEKTLKKSWTTIQSCRLWGTNL